MAKVSKNLKKQLRKAIILLIIFATALAAYFAWSFQNVEAEYTVYTSMEEPRLPVAYVDLEGLELNTMHGYRQDMGNRAVSDLVTILPEDRELDIRIAEYGNAITGISYEIRSLDLQHFVERTEVRDIRSEGGSTYARLPIQNLIARDTQYLLTIQVDMAEEQINYYTRIVWTEDQYINGMIDFARSFAEKTFDYDAARELTTYLETSETADNSNLGEVNIESSFSQLTWGDSDMRMASVPDIAIKEYDGIMSVIELSYLAERTDSAGNTERYMVQEDYTLRQGSERIYLMDYVRNTDQIFDGSKYLFAGKRINLGISSDGTLQDMSSESGRYIAFKSNRELWCYDQEDRIAVSVFSFRSGTDDGVRANYDRHDIKILSMDDGGVLDFVVYGYMNRGAHEGYNGIAYYRYDFSADRLTEIMFMPLSYTFERISLELSELCRKGANDMLYIKQSDSVLAVDLNSLEMVVVASGLRSGTYAVDRLQTKFAWQDGEPYQSARVRLLDIESGTTRTIEAADGEYLRVVGFSNDDLIIGHAGSGDSFSINGRIKGLPMYSIEILNGSLGLEKEYSRESIYVDNVHVEGSRIMFTLYRKNTDGTGYEFYGEDTIVSTESLDTEDSRIMSADDGVRKKIYYVSLDNEIRTTRSLEVRAPEQISYENSGTLEAASQSRPGAEQIVFYSYAGGELRLRSSDLAEAIEATYEDMGYVTDGSGNLVFNRADRTEVTRISNPVQAAYPLIVNLESFSGSRISSDEGIAILDTYGLSLNQLLYYVYKGIPAAVLNPDGSYVLIYGYDNQNILMYDPQAQDEASREISMPRDQAEELLWSLNFDSVSAISYR